MLAAGLFVMAFAYFAAMPVFSYFWMPAGGRPALNITLSLSGGSAFMCALSILSGGAVVLEASGWAVLFVAANGGGLWVFLFALMAEIGKNRR